MTDIPAPRIPVSCRVHRTKNVHEISRIQRILNEEDGLPVVDIEGRLWWGAFLPGGVAIAMSAIRVSQEGCIWLSTCGVLPAYRGQGIQRRLIKARLKHADLLNLPAYTYTINGNHASARNLITCGFKPCTPPPEHFGKWAGSRDVLYWGYNTPRFL